MERGKTSFPSSLGQHNSSPLIAQSELEVSEVAFPHMSWPQMLPGLNVFQEGCTDMHHLSQGELLGRPAGLPAGQEAMGWWWKPIGCQQTCT